jgi:NADPH:quinone reductase-like Zn-dependent oxidoreductase
MKAIRIHNFGGAGAMQMEDLPQPEPKPDEMLVKVKDASLNPVDFKTAEGRYPVIEKDKLPVTLGRDIAGTVEACGREIQNFQPGDAIYAMLGDDRGAFAEYVVVKASEAAPKPELLSFAEAASVPLAALTAWQGLFDHGGLEKGMRVLIHGGAGGVGHFAVQFAKERGAFVATTVSSSDFDFVSKLGADQIVDYRNERFEQRIDKVDMVFDLVGGDTQSRSWQVLKPGGILVSTLGQPDEDKARQHKVRAVGYHAHPDAAELAEIGMLIDAGKVRPEVEETFAFADASKAELHLENNHVRGKLVLELAA